MFRITEKIQIGDYVFNSILDTEINTSYDSITDTAMIKFKNVLYREKNQPTYISSSTLTSLIKRGDVVKIWNGYDTTEENLTLKFSGFVDRIQPDENITVYAQDYGYVLKNIQVETQRIKDATLMELVETVIGHTLIFVDYIDKDANVGTWQIDNNNYVSAIQIFDELKSKFGLVAYFRDVSTLKIGKLDDITGNTYNFIFEHNIINNNLTYRADHELNLSIKGVSILDNNERITRYAYLTKNTDEDGDHFVITVSQSSIAGEQRTLTFYNRTAAQLAQDLRDNFYKYIYIGYSGNFETFLEPSVTHGDYVNLYSLKSPEKNGRYRVKSVKERVSDSGGRQTIELDYKVKDLQDIRTGVNNIKTQPNT